MNNDLRPVPGLVGYFADAERMKRSEVAAKYGVHPVYVSKLRHGAARATAGGAR